LPVSETIDRRESRVSRRETVWPLVLLPLAAVTVHLIWIQGYGYFRDELYYLACARHPAWGYVDQPPLSIWILWIVTHTIGASRAAIRLLPALTIGAVVWLTGAMTRRIGGGRYAQALAMVCVLAAPEYLAVASIFSMNVFDILFWTLSAYLLIRILAGDESRWWPVLGLVLGLGLLNKISVLWFGFGLACGLLLTRERRWLRTPGPWIAGAIAGVMFLPYVLWQIPHDWATLEFMRNATSGKMTAVSPLAFLAAQVINLEPLALPVWLAGLVCYLTGAACVRGRGDNPAALRVLGVIFVVVLLLLIVNGTSRAGYLSPAYPMLFAAGALAIERSIRRIGWKTLQPITLALLTIAGAALAPLAMPILSVPRYVAYAAALGVTPSTEEKKAVGALPQFYADMQGWDAMVADVARVYEALPPADRAQAAIFTGNYGEAGAMDLMGPLRGLPAALSGHNNYWIWGPRDYTGEVMIVLVPADAKPRLDQVFASVEQVGAIDCGDCMPYENHAPIFLCRHPRVPLDRLWPALKHYE
jgi:hypothetical protein